MMTTIIRVSKTLGESGQLAVHGLTEKVLAEHIAALEDPSRSFTTDMHFVWGTKKSTLSDGK